MKYQFVKEHDDTFEVKHPDGSSFHIAKQAIGPEVHKRIKALKMADGGEVPEDNTLKNSDPTLNESQMSEGDISLRRYLGFGPDSSVPPPTTTFNEYNAQASIPEELPQTPPIEAPTEVNRAPSAQVAPSGVPQAALPPSAIPPQPSALPATPNPLDPSALMGAQNKALDTQQAAIKQNAATQQKEYRLQAKQELDYAKSAEHAEAEVQKITAPWRAENEQLYKAIREEKIDPNRLWNNMSTGNKIGASLGILLSGIGAGLQGPGARNMAMDVIDKTIDRDIEGQKMELGKKQTLFSENLRRIGDERSAAALTKSQMLTSLQAQTHASAARINSAQALAESQRLSAEIDMSRTKLMNDAATMKMGMQGGSFDPAILVERLVPKERQAEVFKEIKDAQNIRNGSKEGLAAFDKASEEQKVGSKNVIPGVNSPYVGQLKASVLPQFQNIDGTVRQAAMDAFLPTITPAILDSKHTIEEKRRTLENWYVAHSSAPTAKGYHIDLDKFGSTTTQQPPQEVERIDKRTGKVALFDPKTQAFLRYK